MATATDADLFHKAASTPSDINEHLRLFRALAAHMTSVTEMGVRSGVSTIAWAAGMGRDTHLRCMDLSPKPPVFDVIAASALCDMSFHQGNVLTAEPTPCDLLFIDTFHVYGQLKRELARHSGCCNHCILLHDTTVDAEHGEALRMGFHLAKTARDTGIPLDEITRGLWPAVQEFCEEHKATWYLARRYTNNNGLTVLVRTDSALREALEQLLPVGETSVSV